MSRPDGESGCTGAPNPIRSRSSSHSEFAFAFRNKQFSDCTLRLHLQSEPVGSGRDSGAARVPQSPEAGRGVTAMASASGSDSAPRETVKEVPASKLFLVAKSRFFAGMFNGEFSERHAHDSGIDIYISEDDEASFMDLLRFMYSGFIPEEVSSFASCIRLLVLADRFEVRGAMDQALELLSAFLPRLSPEDALQLLSLPQSVQQALSLGDIVEKAKRKLVETYGALLASPSDAAFLRMPKPCLLTLLDSDSLAVDTEDAVVEAAMAWVSERYSDPRDRAEELATIVFPRIRFQALSPKMALSLGAFLLVPDPSAWGALLLPDSDAATPAPAARSALSLPLPARQPGLLAGSVSHSRKRGPCMCAVGSRGHLDALLKGGDHMSTDSPRNSPIGNEAGASAAASRASLDANTAAARASLDANTGAARASLDAEHPDQLMRTSPRATALCVMALTKALVAYAEDEVVRSGCIPRNKSLQSLLTGQACRPPRKLSQAPHSLYLDISRERCMDWPPSATYIAATSPAFVGGKWFTLGAQVPPETRALGLYVTCDKALCFAGGMAAPFKVKIRFCVQTASSCPAYQALGTLERTFEETSLGWGLSNALSTPWDRVLEDAGHFFPMEALRFRADFWFQ